MDTQHCSTGALWNDKARYPYSPANKTAWRLGYHSGRCRRLPNRSSEESSAAYRAGYLLGYKTSLAMETCGGDDGWQTGCA